MDTITISGGENFYYSSKETVIQRVQGAKTKTTYMTIYIGEQEDLIIYEHNKKETWYYKKSKYESFVPVQRAIEKRKQALRLKGKYKNLSLDTSLSYRKMLKMYCDITDACKAVKKFAKQIYKKLGYSRSKDKISIRQAIIESKRMHWKYNYLFTEYFEEEAN